MYTLYSIYRDLTDRKEGLVSKKKSDVDQIEEV